MKIVLIGSCKLPIPPVNGGGVQKLLYECVLKQNEIDNKVEFLVYSPYSNNLDSISNKMNHSSFHYIKFSKISIALDKITLFVFSKIFRKKRLLSISYIFRTLSYRSRIKREMLKEQFDIIVFENSIPLLSIIKNKKISKKCNNRYVYHAHSIPKKYYGNKRLLLDAYRIFVLSAYMKNELCNDPDFKLISNNIRVIMNCVNTKFFTKVTSITQVELKEKHGFKNNDFVCLFIGRLSPEKGIVELLDAIKQIDNPRVKLLIVGSNFYDSKIKSPFENTLISMCNTIKERVCFTGFISENSLPEIYSLADIVILPSTWEEPAGATMLEALSTSSYLITTNSGGIPEYMGNGTCVILEKEKDLVNEIKDEIIKAMENDTTQTLFRSNARLRALEFDCKRYLEDFISNL